MTTMTERGRKGRFGWRGMAHAVLFVGVFLFIYHNESKMHSLNMGIEDIVGSSTTTTTTLGQLDVVVSEEELYRLAREESFGFFDNIPQDEWLRRKLIAQSRNHFPAHKQAAPNRRHRYWPGDWHSYNWEVDFSCDAEDTVGGIRDGRKWVCDPHRLNREGCLVYSIGSNGDFTFEVGIQKLAPLCEIHTFDFRDYSSDMVKWGVNGTFHANGLKPSYESWENRTGTKTNARFGKPPKRFENKQRTMAQIQKELGHEGRRIDIFKIDCEGCEWKSYLDWIRLDIQQILVELHETPPAAHEILTEMHQQGYVIFHKEPNAEWAGGNCVEYSFLKLSTNFTQGH